MKNKKILWIILLVLIIAIVVVVVVLARKQEGPLKTSSSPLDKGNGQTEIENTNINNKSNEYIETKLDDGILYSLDGNKVEADIKLGDNYFDTTINDMYLNPNDYENKKIEIEGMYLESGTYTFVGRYSLSNLCPNCPQGYSVFEYQLNGKLDKEFKVEEDWIKVIGTFKKGIDEENNNMEYYYLEVINLELMNEKGKDTVEN